MIAAEVVAWALFVGLVAELLSIFELRHKVPADLPYWLRSKFYWWTVVGMILALALRQAISSVPKYTPAPDPRTID